MLYFLNTQYTYFTFKPVRARTGSRRAKIQKSKKTYLIFFLGALTIFCSKRCTKRFTAGEIGSARLTQFSTANRFMPRFVRYLRYFELITIHDLKFELPVKINSGISGKLWYTNSPPHPNPPNFLVIQSQLQNLIRNTSNFLISNSHRGLQGLTFK